MTVATVATEFFTGNQQKSLDFLVSHKYISPFSKSRFSRRLHQIPESLWQFALHTLAQVKKQTTAFLVDSSGTFRLRRKCRFPVAVCKNIRIRRCKIYKTQDYRGYTASKKEYFYGLKVCLIVTDTGRPVELVFVPGSTHDCKALRSIHLRQMNAMDIDLPEQSILIGDKGFLDRAFEADLKEDASVHLIVPSRSNQDNRLKRLLCHEATVKRLRAVDSWFDAKTGRNDI